MERIITHLLILTFFTVLAIGNHPSDGGAVAEFQPEFAQPLENVSVSLGRDATFTCVVRSLGGYRVGWVRADSKAIQAIHTHVITHNPRVSVTHSDHSTWHLHIKGVREEDRGTFMCQVNTDPMISQISYLEVVIPPDFIPEETSGDVMAPEGSTVKLNCNARGHPTPSIVWKRENGQNITLKSPSGAKSQVTTFEGNLLRLQKVSRADMGPYFCIASNGVPPSISKRIIVSVHFHPVIHVPNQLVSTPVNTDVTLECNVEAYPRSIHFWIKDNGAMIITGDRYEVQETTKSMFEVKMMLIIKKFQPEDSGRFSCIAKNSIGDVESTIKLHELRLNAEEVALPAPPKANESPGNAFAYEGEDDYSVDMTGFGGTRRQSATLSTGERNSNVTRAQFSDTATSVRKANNSNQKNANKKGSHHLNLSDNNSKNQKHQQSNNYHTVVVPVSRGAGELGTPLDENHSGGQASPIVCKISFIILFSIVVII